MTGKIFAAIKPRFKLAEHAELRYRYTAEIGTTIEDLTRPEFWAHLARELKPTYRVDVLVEDMSLFVELLVMDVGNTYAKMFVLRSVELAGNQVAELDVDGAYSVQWSGPHTKHRVVHKKTKNVIKDGFEDKGSALRFLTEYLRSQAA